MLVGETLPIGGKISQVGEIEEKVGGANLSIRTVPVGWGL